MKTVTPKYYRSFKCIGAECKHNCCIGWEIDIDPQTMSKYENVGGVFGKRLKSSVEKDGDCPHFILGDKERCPFLNKDNLCDIIINIGESYLCEICDAHPRFKNFFSDRTEIGLGLCCEEACRLIIFDKEPFSLETVENTELCDGNSSFEEELIRYRDSLISAITDSYVPIDERIIKISSVKIPELNIGKWSEYLLSLEIMSDEWKKLLIRAVPISEPLTYKGYEKELERLICYFVYRYVANENYDEKSDTVVAFSVLCSQIITSLWSHFAKSDEDKVEICRLFSQEIEYSTDNVDDIISKIEDYNEI